MFTDRRTGFRQKFIGKAIVLLLGAAALSQTGCGSGTGLTVSHGPVPLSVQYAYTANLSGGSLSGYSQNPSTGALTALAGFPVASGVNPYFLIHDPSNRFLIVTDIAAGDVRVYGIDASTGMLTEVLPSPYAVGGQPRSLAISPNGQLLYVAGQKLNTVAGYSMNSSGVLTPVPGSPFSTGGNSPSFGCCVVMDPTGRFVYAEDLTQVYAFEVNNSTGALALVSTVAGPQQGDGLAVDPAGAFLYAVGAGTNTAMSFAINPGSGALTTAQSSPLALQDWAFTIILGPTGKFAYTVEAGETLVAYSVANGTLTSLNATYAGALGTLNLTIDPTGQFLYAPQTGMENNVSGFRIGANGLLTVLPGSPTPSGTQPTSVTIVSQ